MARSATPLADDEQSRVLRRRYIEARRAGMTCGEARIFAHDRIDVGELRRLVSSGCPRALLARILL